MIEQGYHDSLGQDNSILCMFVSEATTWLSQASGLLVGCKMLEGLVSKSLDYGRTRFTNSSQTCICRTHNLIEYAWMCVSILFYRKKNLLRCLITFPSQMDMVEYSVVHCGSDISKCCILKWLLFPWEDLSRHQWRGNSFQGLEIFSEFCCLIFFFWIFMALSISDSPFLKILFWFLYYILILIVSLSCLFTLEFLQIVLPYSLSIFSFHCLISHYNILCLP